MGSKRTIALSNMFFIHTLSSMIDRAYSGNLMQKVVILWSNSRYRLVLTLNEPF